jgi:hypothetical protein
MARRDSNPVRGVRALVVSEKAWHGLVARVATAPAGVRPSPDLRSGHSRPGGETVVAKREAEELLLIEEADAWFEYLETTRSQSESRYHEIEPWAWARLTQRLRAIKARRARLRPAAA